jgi:hypothetical protein
MTVGWWKSTGSHISINARGAPAQKQADNLNVYSCVIGKCGKALDNLASSFCRCPTAALASRDVSRSFSHFLRPLTVSWDAISNQEDAKSKTAKARSVQRWGQFNW